MCSMTVPTPIIDHDKLRDEIKKNSVRIIDVRREDDYKQGHIKNSVNLPLAKLLKDDNTDRSIMWEYDEKGYGKDGAGMGG